MIRDKKILALLLCELFFLVITGIAAFRGSAEINFHPSDFADNARGRENIIVDDKEAAFLPEAKASGSEGDSDAGIDLMSGKFAIGSGCYIISVDYEAGSDDSYIEMVSQSHVTETVSPKIELNSERKNAVSRVVIPIGRSMHDIQMSIHYGGSGSLKVYSIKMTGDRSYGWVPVAGYLLLFVLFDAFFILLFSGSGSAARAYLRIHYEYIVIAVIAILASLPAFADFLYVGHDLDFHLARIIAVSKEMQYGQFPVRMLTDMLKGYGYPTSTFYCDLFLYPFALLYLIGLPLRMCWQAYIIIINLITAAVSYRVFLRISGEVNTGLSGAFIYTLSAYRIVDIYLRSAMGEFTAITFIPLVILGIWQIYYSEDGDNAEGWGFLGIGMTGIALSHLLTLEMTALFLILFCLMEYRKTFTVTALLALGKAALMTVLLSCWFIFPMLLSMNGFDISMYAHQFYIQAQGAYPSQVFNPFMRGAGLSTTATPMEMPLSIGGGMTAALALLLWAVLKPDIRGVRKKQRMILVLTIISLVFSMYFFPWDSIAGITEGRLDAVSKLARMVQYPWRFLEMTTALLAVAAVAILHRIYTENNNAYRLWTALLLSGTVLSLGVFYDPFINEARWTRADDEYYMDYSIGGEEYLPSDSGHLSELTYDAEAADDTAVIIEAYEKSGGERRLSIRDTVRDTSILIPLFAYPGYTAEDSASGSSMELQRGDKGRVSLSVPAGYSGTVRIHYREPGLWRVFEIISLLSACFFLILGIRYLKISCIHGDL